MREFLERTKENVFSTFTDKAIINMILYNANILDLGYYVDKVSKDKYSADDIMKTLALMLLEHMDKVDTENKYKDEHIITNRVVGNIDFEESIRTGSLSRGYLHTQVQNLNKDTSHLDYIKTALLISRRNVDKDTELKIDKKLRELRFERLVYKFTYTKLKTMLHGNTDKELQLVLFVSWLIINIVEPDEDTGRLDYRSIDNYKLIGSIFEKFVRNVLKNELDNREWVSLMGSSDREILNGSSKVICDIVIGHKNKKGNIADVYLFDTKAYVDTEQNSNLNSTGGEMHKYFNSWLGKLEGIKGVSGTGFNEISTEKSKYAPYWMDHIKCCLVYPQLDNSEGQCISRVYAVPEIYEAKVEVKGTLSEMKESVLKMFYSVHNIEYMNE